MLDNLVILKNAGILLLVYLDMLKYEGILLLDCGHTEENRSPRVSLPGHAEV